MSISVFPLVFRLSLFSRSYPVLRRNLNRPRVQFIKHKIQRPRQTCRKPTKDPRQEAHGHGIDFLSDPLLSTFRWKIARNSRGESAEKSVRQSALLRIICTWLI